MYTFALQLFVGYTGINHFFNKGKIMTDSLPATRRPEPHEMKVTTRRPETYVLVDEQTGQHWRGSANGWVRDVESENNAKK